MSHSLRGRDILRKNLHPTHRVSSARAIAETSDNNEWGDCSSTGDSGFEEFPMCSSLYKNPIPKPRVRSPRTSISPGEHASSPTEEGTVHKEWSCFPHAKFNNTQIAAMQNLLILLLLFYFPPCSPLLQKHLGQTM